MPLEVGSRLGPYAVAAKIGEGGMGEVYRAGWGKETNVIRHLVAVASIVLVFFASGVASSLTAQEPSVREGLNERFLSPDLDTAAMASRFEGDTREVFVRRHDVVAALELEPGMHIADVGAGSGFFTALMAEAAGPMGHVYAVEIAPQWIEHLNRRIRGENLDNVSVVLGTDRSVELPDASVDLIFSSDTYHHFEYPQTILASIARALRPGGRWVIVDYDKIPGVTPPSRMEHLRVGQAEAVAEVLTVGFELVRAVDLDLEQNYMAIFRRP